MLLAASKLLQVDYLPTMTFLELTFFGITMYPTGVELEPTLFVRSLISHLHQQARLPSILERKTVLSPHYTNVCLGMQGLPPVVGLQ